MAYKIALVDDQREILLSLSTELAASGLVDIVFSAPNGKQYLQQMENLEPEKRPQAVIMDINMPVMDGIEAVALGSALYTDVQYIMFTISDDDDNLFDALKAGASGYLLKHEPLANILNAIRETVEKEGAPMSPGIARKILKFLVKNPSEKNREKPAATELTEKEVEVVKNMVAGLTYKQIADKMILSPFTIRNYTTKIYTKLHITSKAQAVKLAMKNKWV